MSLSPSQVRLPSVQPVLDRAAGVEGPSALRDSGLRDCKLRARMEHSGQGLGLEELATQRAGERCVAHQGVGRCYPGQLRRVGTTVNSRIMRSVEMPHQYRYMDAIKHGFQMQRIHLKYTKSEVHARR